MALPSFFDRRKAGLMFQPDLSIIEPAANASGWDTVNADPARPNIGVLWIDMQPDFCLEGPGEFEAQVKKCLGSVGVTDTEPLAADIARVLGPSTGSLYVPGAQEDVAKTAEWLYNHGHAVTSIRASLDTHHIFSIFHPWSWWDDSTNNHPAPFTVITPDVLRAGKIRPFTMVLKDAVEYVEYLAANGKPPLVLWPTHCVQFAAYRALMPLLAEAAMFWSMARIMEPKVLSKGQEGMTENYGIFSPEKTVPSSSYPTAQGLNLEVIQAIEKLDALFVFGQAKSHCVLTSLQQLFDGVDGRALNDNMKKRVYIVEDCMSSVPDTPLPDGSMIKFNEIAEAEFARFAAMGANIVTSNDGLCGLV